MSLLPTGVPKAAAARTAGMSPAAAAAAADGAAAALKSARIGRIQSKNAGAQSIPAGELKCTCTVLRLNAPVILHTAAISFQTHPICHLCAC